MQISKKAPMPKGIKEVRSKGKLYYYHRATNQRIKALPGTTAFRDEVAELEERILQTRVNAAAGILPIDTLIALPLGSRRSSALVMQWLHAFELHSEWTKFSDAWKHVLTRWANDAATRWPEMTQEQAATDAARAWLDEWREEITKTGTPAAADQCTAAMRRLWKFARDRRMISLNPMAEKFDYKRRIGTRTTINHPFELVGPEGAAILNDPDVHNAMQLAALTTMRVSNLCALEWPMIDAEGWLTFTQVKHAEEDYNITVSLPIFALPQLAGVLKRCPRHHPTRILVSHDWSPCNKKPRALTADNLGLRWGNFKHTKEGKPYRHLHWHDLRGTGINWMDEAGCTDKEIASVSGHLIKTDDVSRSITAYRRISREHAVPAYQKLAKYLAAKGWKK